MDGLHTWVINLDRATERLARVSRQLDGIGLLWTRLRAVEGRALPPQEVAAALDADTFRRWHGMEPALGEVGCYLSHVAAMRALLDSPHAAALILEDDVLLTPALRPALEGLMRHRGRWDMAKLSAVHSGTPQPVLEITAGHHLAVMLSRCTGASAYLVSRHAAEVYLRQLLPMQLPYDHAFDKAWALGLKVRLVTPCPCVHDEQIATTIATGGASRKFPWYRRWSTYGYRLRNELARVAWGLRETWRERRA